MIETSIFVYVALNLLFGALFAATARAVLTRGTNPFLWSFVLMTVVIVYGLPVQEYSKGVSVDTLLLGHVLMLVYLTLSLLVARHDGVKLNALTRLSSAVPSIVIVSIIAGWLAYRVYLAMEYGPEAVLWARVQELQAQGLVALSSLEVAVMSVTTLLLFGAMALVTIEHASGNRRRSPLMTCALSVVLLFIVSFTESPIGARRLLLVLGLLWTCIAWARSGLSWGAWLRKYGRQVAVVGAMVLGVSFYYTRIRINDPSDIFAARTPAEILTAAVRFAASWDRPSYEKGGSFWRSGPFDFWSRVVEVVTTERKSSAGEATLFSLALSVPKALFPGEKPAGDVDQILEQHLGIYPDQPFLNVDYPTSLPAIAVADWGPLGVFPAAVVLGLAFVTTGLAFRRLGRLPLALALILGFDLQLAASQEAGLTGILSGARDCGVALFFAMSGHGLYSLVRVGIRPHRTVAPSLVGSRMPWPRGGRASRHDRG